MVPVSTPTSECTPYPWLRRLLPRWRDRTAKPAVFIWIPKTAGTSIQRALEPYGLRKLNRTSRIERKFKGSESVTFGHFDYAALVESGKVPAEFDARSFKFAFVRNPFERVVSLWAYLRPNMAFDAFVERLSEGIEPVGLYNRSGLSQCNPQIHWLRKDGCWLTDYVGRYETLQADFEDLCHKLGLPRVDLPFLNKTAHGTYRTYYTKFSRSLVRDLYEDDLETLGYSF